jgi:GH15 family glucan-1,4-alpha-glucosidase
MAAPIEDYALIGDTHTAALVSRQGSIDWLCLPRFDSPACFAALLGEEANGRWLLAPAGGVREVRRRYQGDTLVLETEYRTDDGVVRVVDCTPPRQWDPDVARVVEGVRGRVPMRMELTIRFDYGSALMGRREEALAIFERLLTLRNDVGLLAEEYDPATGRQLGNFPQAFSHVALVNTANYLSEGPAQPWARHRA